MLGWNRSESSSENTGRTCKVANYRFMLAANHCRISNQLWPFYSPILQKCTWSCSRQSHQSRLDGKHRGLWCMNLCCCLRLLACHRRTLSVCGACWLPDSESLIQGWAPARYQKRLVNLNISGGWGDLLNSKGVINWNACYLEQISWASAIRSPESKHAAVRISAPSRWSFYGLKITA